jgi:hypothetical protein
VVKILIENIELAGRKLIVPREVSENGELTLDGKGQALLSPDAAAILCSVPGFKSIGENTVKDEPQNEDLNDKLTNTLPKEPAATEKLEVQEGEAKGIVSPEEAPTSDDAAASKNSEPSPDWKKEELATWLTERGVEFKIKDGKEVLLGKAFKYLENRQPKEQ